ncbi:PA2778 family cysteine peptidase [Marinivivus vitaminiproducens]|uniref:PA2778 family cysteine peptidase n=1 Tax=Marinivivus vitaminiproducens TaxID=3035935 RepID=UPI0027A07C6D|nr:PA2778 family cysteine peptidase [Geminicoccaceae bacterium SCSIO 64248]
MIPGGHRLRTALLALFVAALSSACSSTPQTDALLALPPAGLPRQVELTGVPFFPQAGNDCGPAALATVLGQAGVTTTIAELEPLVMTPDRQGTLQNDLIAAARREGRLVVPVDTVESLTEEIAAGHPVLVFQNLGVATYPIWHYAVAVGYDLDTPKLVLRSGEEARRLTYLATFERTWERSGRFGLVVVEPGDLPASADADAIMAAAASLEQAGQADAAAATYAAATERWPDRAGLWLGLGNASYAAGRLDASAAAFAEATERAPDDAAAWNNLAHVLHEQGKEREATDAARRAIGLGGPYAATAAETLRAIERRT